jgi:ABC-type nitrate/sulfonate/bicarbonate transport system ATPase subunit
MLAGFEAPDEGRVLLGGDDLAAVPPHRRPVNMMFQSYALFPHLTVAGNIAFGLRQDRLPKPAIAARVEEMLALVKLEGLGARKPDQLSGGQRQRVALARSLAKRPQVLLLDEPMAALDKKLREETQFELMDLQARLGTAFVIVTHDQEEAMTVAHRIAVMDRGEIVQVATPAEIYEQPQSRWVAAFIGDVNLIEGGVVAIDAAGAVIEDGGGRRYRVAEAAGAFGGRTGLPSRCGRKSCCCPLGPLSAAIRGGRRERSAARPGVGHRLSRRRLGLQGAARRRDADERHRSPMSCAGRAADRLGRRGPAVMGALRRRAAHPDDCRGAGIHNDRSARAASSRSARRG